MTKEKALAKIAELVLQAESNISEAEHLAREHELTFDFCPAYGMGGTYNGGNTTWLDDGWNPSSMSC
jgi:hypothetical protein